MAPSAAFAVSGFLPGSAHVTKDSRIFGKIVLKSFANPKNSWDLNNDEKFAAFEKYKGDGNNFFKSAAFDKALKRFE